MRRIFSARYVPEEYMNTCISENLGPNRNALEITAPYKLNPDLQYNWQRQKRLI